MRAKQIVDLTVFAKIDIDIEQQGGLPPPILLT
jgi:hypothetical protein